jgi:monoamine oxidase
LHAAFAVQAELRGDIDGLLDAFPPVRRRLPGIRAVHRSEWGSNPLTRGSYSYPAAGSGLEDIGVLAQPVCCDGRPVLLFAGEATHTSHYGTASGAFLTGEREADRLLAA